MFAAVRTGNRYPPIGRCCTHSKHLTAVSLREAIPAGLLNGCCLCPLLPAGLTQLSYSRRIEGGPAGGPVPTAPEGTAAALAAVLQPELPPDPPPAISIDKLRLDSRLMQVRTHVCSLYRLQGSAVSVYAGCSAASCCHAAHACVSLKA